jgi:DNA-binding CsgD family transcriptional regulator
MTIQIGMPLSLSEREQVMRSFDFTPQQARVVESTIEGKPDKRIAIELGVSFSTVRKHLSVAFEKTGATGRGELTAIVYARMMELRARREGQQK